MTVEAIDRARAGQNGYRIEPVPLGDPRIRYFTMFPWRLYKSNPCWTPPLKAELLGNRLLGIVGLLQPHHSYHRYADVTHFLAWCGKEPVGRISAAVNHRFNEYYNTRIGFFGFFEVINDYEVARMLLDEACNWLKDRGMTLVRGPGQYSNTIQERQGILIDGFTHPPTFNMTYNPPYYAEFLEKYGFMKAKDYHSYIIDVPRDGIPLLKELSLKIRKRRKLETRSLNMKHLEEEVCLLKDIWNDTWTENWGFLPVTDEEATSMARFLRFVDTNGIRFAFIDGEPAAIVCAIPDPCYCLRPRWKWYGDSDMVRLARLIMGRRKILRAEIFFLGIRPSFRRLGLETVLLEELLEYGSKLHYQTCEASWVLEDNRLAIKPIETFGLKRYKTWRIYDMPLEESLTKS